MIFYYTHRLVLYSAIIGKAFFLQQLGTNTDTHYTLERQRQTEMGRDHTVILELWKSNLSPQG